MVQNEILLTLSMAALCCCGAFEPSWSQTNSGALRNLHTILLTALDVFRFGGSSDSRTVTVSDLTFLRTPELLLVFSFVFDFATIASKQDRSLHRLSILLTSLVITIMFSIIQTTHRTVFF